MNRSSWNRRESARRSSPRRIALVFFLAVFALAPRPVFSTWRETRWDIEHGLPHNTVRALAQDRRGYIWLGTPNGLVRFDGLQFRVHNRWNTPELKHDAITCLWSAADGALWAGTDGGGIVVHRGSAWQNHEAELSNPNVLTIYADRRGSLWVGTQYGLNRLREGKWRRYTMGDGLPGNLVHAVVEDGDGTLLAGGDGVGVAVLNGERWQTAIGGDAPRGIRALVRGRDGAVRIAAENGLFLYRRHSVQRLPAVPATTALLSLLEDRGGRWWLGGEGGGLMRLEGEKIRFVPSAESLNRYIPGILEDHEGTLWLGTLTEGLVQVRETALQVLPVAPTTGRGAVRALCRDRRGIVWAAARAGALLRLEGNGTPTLAASLPTEEIGALWPDQDGTLWVGTENGGLYVVRDGRVETAGRGLGGFSVRVMLRDRRGELWLGGPGGLARHGGAAPRRCGREEGFPPGAVHDLAEDAYGVLWIAAESGLFQYDSGRFREVRGPQDRSLTHVTALFHDHSGILWIAAAQGLHWRHNNGIHRIGVRQGVPEGDISAIREDRGDRLWLSTGNSLTVVPRFQLLEYGAGRRQWVEWLMLDENDGLPAGGMTTAARPAALRLADGTLLFAGTAGIVRAPAALAPAPRPQAVAVDSVLADNREIGGLDGIALPRATGMLEFYFSATAFRKLGQVRLQYRLEGFETEWRTLTGDDPRAAIYSNLRPGAYRFQVRAADDSRPQVSAAFAFRIGAPAPSAAWLLLLLAPAAGLGLVLKRRGGKTRTAPAAPVEAVPPEAEKPEPARKYATSALSEETAAETEARLLERMESQAEYLDPDLTLAKLAELLHIHPNHLSRVINERLGKSFRDFLNQYRIAAAAKKLRDPSESGKTILEIAFETGFYSKSVFNAAFKKFTGMTPQEYRKQSS